MDHIPKNQDNPNNNFQKMNISRELHTQDLHKRH